MNKITKKDRFYALLTIPAVANDPDMVAFIDHEIELLDRKNSGTKSKTPTQVANEGIKEKLIDALSDSEPMTATEVGKIVDPSLSNQRVSALLKQLCDAQLVKKESVKGKSMFSLA